MPVAVVAPKFVPVFLARQRIPAQEEGLNGLCGNRARHLGAHAGETHADTIDAGIGFYGHDEEVQVGLWRFAQFGFRHHFFVVFTESNFDVFYFHS